MTPRTRKAAGRWEASFVELTAQLEARLGIVIECVLLQGTGLADIIWDADGPRLGRAPSLRWVRLGRTSAPAPAPPGSAVGGNVDPTGYETVILGSLWDWADRHHANELEGGSRTGRPPVLRREFASRAVLVPPDPAKASDIVAAVPEQERHRWFRSFKSSQSLAQSVFGAVRSFGRLDLLDDLTADCGRPAFLEDARGADLVLEHKVQSLGEPRQTSVDVLLEGGSRRVAVECKLTEREFGACSRPQLHPRDRNYAEQHCDGTYRVQRGRRERCALTEIGVRYWTYLPDLFDWTVDRDLRPCPFAEVYQLARNALAATVTADGLDPGSGHVLVVYDARNPAYASGGAARRQYEAAIRACRVPGLFRRLSWQRLAGAFAGAPELAYLVAGLEDKYGIRPE